MPVVSLTLEDTNRTILADAYFKIIQDIVETVKIPYASLVVVHKDTEVTLTDNKTNVSGLQQTNLPSTAAKRRIITSITEEYNEDELTTTAVHQQAAYPIFQDQDINVYIYPIYVKSDIVIEFSYISPSKIEANRIRDDIRIRLSQTRNITIHDIEYNILVPDIVEEFIADVHTLKSRLVPQTLEDYFKEHSTKRIHIMTDMSNKENAKLAVNERQVRIVGLFDFNSMPEKIEIDNENNNYKVNFSYKLSIDVPRAIVMRYPVMICNRPLQSKYLQFIEDAKVQSKEEYKRDLNYTSQSLHALSHFEAHRQLENRVDIKLPINVPLFDDFNKREGHKGYCILASFLTDVNETDKRTLFNLRDIDPYYIPEPLLQFIAAGERTYIVNPFMSFLYLGLYQDDIHFDNNILTIDNNLNIKSKVDLTLFKPIRVTLSFVLDINMLDQRALNRLLANEEMLLLFLNEYVRVYNNYKTEISTNIIPDNTFYKTFVHMLYHFINRDNFTMLSGIMTILYSDPYIYENTTSILYSNYPDIYRYLKIHTELGVTLTTEDLHRNQKGILDDSKTNKNANHLHTGIENYAMRTVMTNYVISLRQDL